MDRIMSMCVCVCVCMWVYLFIPFRSIKIYVCVRAIHTYSGGKMCHRSATQIRATETSFHRVTIGNAKHPYNNTARSLFIALHFKLTTFK